MKEHEEKMLKLAEALKAKKVKEDAIKAEYKDKSKKKALSTAERLERIERLLGIEQSAN